MTKSQIDRLGQRLRGGSPSEGDLTHLEMYRRSFGPAYGEVVSKLNATFPTMLKAYRLKWTESIIQKLQRGSTKLSRMQDVAGCRLVAADTPQQDWVVDQLCRLFPKNLLVDRRKNPSHGYRAVHLIVPVHDRLVEIQVRTALQHLWAEVSEKLAERHGVEVKYGGGPKWVRSELLATAGKIADIERVEELLYDLRQRAKTGGELTATLDAEIERFEAMLSGQRLVLTESLRVLHGSSER